MFPVKLKDTQSIRDAFTFLSGKTRRDIAIMLLGTKFLEEAKAWAKKSLLECADCDTYMTSDETVGVKKITPSIKMYDDGQLDNLLADRARLQIEIEEINNLITARKKEIKPTNTQEGSPYFKGTKS